jgi:hypothetical protein
MTDTKREGPDRRRSQPGGRRESDLRALTPALQAEAAEYASEIARGLGILIAALEDADIVAAREASTTIKKAADALRLLLATAKSMRQGT